MKVTKQQLEDLFKGTQTWEQITTDLMSKAGIEITDKTFKQGIKMVQQMFKDNGYNLRARKQPKPNWFEVIDDLGSANHVNGKVETEEVA